MFPIIPVPDDAEEDTEPLGTKFKFWFEGKRTLFKASKAKTGEHWGEKVACELCALLNIPHAHYELALWRGQLGVICTNIAQPPARLVLGNELLARVHHNYPEQAVRGVVEHNLTRIHKLMSRSDWQLPPEWHMAGIENPFDLFVGYVMLDAWIANQDRHHENWGVIVQGRATYLSPSFDHAACLGQNERDDKRRRRLETRDKNEHISHYVCRAKSAFYDSSATNKPLSTLAAFTQAAKLSPAAGRVWLAALARISSQDCQTIFAALPPQCGMTETAKAFALQMLELNRARLLALAPSPGEGVG